MKGVEARSSTIILAMKRSGTNFCHDILAPYFQSAVNEPLELHIDQDPENPLSCGACYSGAWLTDVIARAIKFKQSFFLRPASAVSPSLYFMHDNNTTAAQN